MPQKINYPVDLLPVVIMGKPARWQRVFIMRPVKKGNYSILIYPKGVINEKYTTRYDFSVDDIDGAPANYLFKIPKQLRMFKNWLWQLSKDPGFSLTEKSGTQAGEARPLLSQLIFKDRPIAEGSFTVQNEITPNDHRFIAWSCNQPFADGDNNEAILNEVVPAGVFDWYEAEVQKFKPSIIWALGDTAYSDGCEATNFVDKFYDYPNLLGQESGKKDLLSAYRRMYRSHWSFHSLQKVMRNYPHISIWDDHEIRDGWGSEANDFSRYNTTVKEMATRAANEYILNLGPRVRAEKGQVQYDAHQAYIEGDIAAFIFDGRSMDILAHTDPLPGVKNLIFFKILILSKKSFWRILTPLSYQFHW